MSKLPGKAPPKIKSEPVLMAEAMDPNPWRTPAPPPPPFKSVVAQRGAAASRNSFWTCLRTIRASHARWTLARALTLPVVYFGLQQSFTLLC